MAVRGAKPKAAHLRLIDGTHRKTRHGSESDLRKSVEDAQQAFGKLERPAFLKGEARKAWDMMIVPAAWLDGSRLVAAVAFCELYAEWRESAKMFPASKHGQMRAYMGELGLTDERNRVAAADKPKDEFFDD